MSGFAVRAVGAAKGVIGQESRILGFWLGVQELVIVTASAGVSDGHQRLGTLQRLSVSPLGLRNLMFLVCHSCHSGLG